LSTSRTVHTAPICDPALIVERKEGLEQYMKALAKDPEILKCRVLREFIETPDVCSPEQHKEFDFGRR